MIILASSSPRRKELLKTIYHGRFLIIPSNADESKVQASNLVDLPLKIALIKGQDISKDHKDDYVISADTIVILNNEKYGKPKDENDAKRMLSDLNEKVHYVVTGYAIFKAGEVVKSRSVISELIIHNMDKKRIQAYINTKSPFDKAGAYGIQDKDYVETELIKGSYENVMGFPTKEIKEDLLALGIKED